MRFQTPRPRENLVSLARILGYRPLSSIFKPEVSLVRPLGQDFPRFHLYLEATAESLVFKLHLDQKRPSYGRETAHSGEYDGELVEAEEKRIKELLSRL